MAVAFLMSWILLSCLRRNNQAVICFVARVGGGNDKLMLANGFLQELFACGIQFGKYVVH